MEVSARGAAGTVDGAADHTVLALASSEDSGSVLGADTS